MKHIVLLFFVLVTAAGYAITKTGISEAEVKKIVIDYHSERIGKVENAKIKWENTENCEKHTDYIFGDVAK
ncbi:hypothetical protein [Bacillus sp. SJS]|uniref:hypothetical protein n=1 Tax=Bacillus sp. SJS TaxID=1423321 RepID=UPI0004DD0F9D|nr:hypothetical protein [Bacillus sp. SJS]KZZ84707.1 hypothetical protein AS29_009240 [Bacillus sp. SJS]